MTELEFMDRLVPRGWLKELCEAWLAMHMEMPLQFAVLSGMVAMGNLIGYEAHARAGGTKVYPNLNGLLASPAGLCRRSRGTEVVMNMADVAGCHVYRGKATREGLLDELLDSPRTLLYADEIAEVLNRRDYQETITQFFASILLRGPGVYRDRTRTTGSILLKDPMLSCLFTGAFDWFATSLPKSAVGGGLMRRFTICCLNTFERPYFDFNDDTDDDAIVTKMGQGLHSCAATLRGKIHADHAAVVWMKEYYAQNLLDIERCANPWMVPHYAGKPSTIVRTAMVMAAAAQDPKLTEERLQQALALVDYYESTMSILFKEIDQASSMSAKVETAVMRLLNLSDGGMLHTDLLRGVREATRIGVKEARDVLQGMGEMGVVVKVDRAGRQGVWPPLRWELPSIKKEANNDSNN